MKHTIISKRPTTFTYIQYKMVNGNFAPVGSGVLINGGAGIVGGYDLLSGIPMEERSKLIPEGVKTVVDDIALEYLMGCDKFKSDIKRGMITVVDGDISRDEADRIAKEDMLDNEHIKDRPFTEKDIKNAGGVITDDNAIDIRKAEENLGLEREKNAGAPQYVINRNLENAERDRVEKERATHRRGRKSRK